MRVLLSLAAILMLGAGSVLCPIRTHSAAAESGARRHQPHLAAEPRPLQGHHQGPHPVRRSPAGHRAQPQGRRLDRSPAEELRLRHRAHQVHLRSAAAAGPQRPAAPAAAAERARRADASPGGGRPRGQSCAHRREQRPDEAAGREAARAQQRARDQRPARSRCSAPRSARRSPTRCTSSARTWTVMAGARRPTTTARGRRW